jgi:hypothetical protein
MAKNSKPTRTSAAYHPPLSRQVDALKRARVELEEEIVQLRLALRIWTEVHRQTTSGAAGSEALNAEMG